jgi:hypothetical protein
MPTSSTIESESESAALLHELHMYMLHLMPADAMLRSGCRSARADEGPVGALVGTLIETEEDVRVRGTDLVKTLLERSEQNRDKNRRELQDKYCYRQASMLLA